MSCIQFGDWGDQPGDFFVSIDCIPPAVDRSRIGVDTNAFKPKKP
jgi:hypothetical protein